MFFIFILFREHVKNSNPDYDHSNVEYVICAKHKIFELLKVCATCGKETEVEEKSEGNFTGGTLLAVEVVSLNSHNLKFYRVMRHK